MQVTSKDHVLKVVTMTRFHFVAGLPTAGARCLLALLTQNPRFSVAGDSPAERVFSVLSAGRENQDHPLSGISSDTRSALLRASLDAVHHARPIASVVFDNNIRWLSHVTALAELFPLSRFVIMVRDPARIAAEMAQEAGAVTSPQALMSEHGVIGAPIQLVHDALSSPASKRLLLIDYDRLLSDPERVLDLLYAFVGEPHFAHDFRMLAARETLPQTITGHLARRVSTPNDATSRRAPKTDLPIWRRSSGSEATMLLSETG
ncbi:sulfotransferase [Litoreibacter halocynthiae]|uniref:Sulfotransferase n=2 Tax=Litoreibacter halocynthiae TaxID=1242689 RepID=A0A4R7LRL8_9RHOB|nr:sulfotransferase [Litoreibacter halocynthiae]